jgi:DNA-binding NarL/FixJ family response regulator
MKIRVTIFEDNENLRLSLYHLVNSCEAYQCAGAFEDCSNLVEKIKDTMPDVVLMDINMPGMNGIEAVRLLSTHFPAQKVLMQTVYDDPEKIFQSILAGASGYILKNTTNARILESIREVYDGGAPMSPSIAAKVLKMVIPAEIPAVSHGFNLSDREKEILSCLVQGMSYKLIGETCFISIDTVRGHIRRIYEKLHVHSKSEAVAKAIKGGIV